MKKIAKCIIDRITKRKPDFIVGRDDPYLLRWWIIPRNPIFNIYLHNFKRSDDGRALHDHMYCNMSILLEGCYTEHTKKGKNVLCAGDWKIRWSGKEAHRIELTHGDCWTIFITGPRYRQWYFHCPQGLVHHSDFSSGNPGEIGKGCEQ